MKQSLLYIELPTSIHADHTIQIVFSENINYHTKPIIKNIKL